MWAPNAGMNALGNGIRKVHPSPHLGSLVNVACFHSLSNL